MSATNTRLTRDLETCRVQSHARPSTAKKNSQDVSAASRPSFQELERDDHGLTLNPPFQRGTVHAHCDKVVQQKVFQHPRSEETTRILQSGKRWHRHRGTKSLQGRERDSRNSFGPRDDGNAPDLEKNRRQGRLDNMRNLWTPRKDDSDHTFGVR